MVLGSGSGFVLGSFWVRNVLRSKLSSAPKTFWVRWPRWQALYGDLVWQAFKGPKISNGSSMTLNFGTCRRCRTEQSEPRMRCRNIYAAAHRSSRLGRASAPRSRTKRTKNQRSNPNPEPGTSTQNRRTPNVEPYDQRFIGSNPDTGRIFRR